MTDPAPGAPPGCPAHADRSRTLLHGPDFASDPHAVYTRLRQYGAVGPVELAEGVPVLLVTSYRAALEVMHNPGTYSRDPRTWQNTIPADSPIRPMTDYRANPLFTDDAEHTRYRLAITDSLSLIEPHELRALVQRTADTLISRFASEGTVDLVGQFARHMPLMVFNSLFGLPDSYSALLIKAFAGVFDGSSPEAAQQANDALTQYLTELLTLKKTKRGPDLTSWLLDHPAGLSDSEVLDQIILTMGAGHEPTMNLIATSLSRMLSDDRYYNTISSGALTATAAITETLWHDPPMSNYSIHFPRHDVMLQGSWVPSGTPLVISFAAANTDPAAPASDPRTGNGAHLAWGSGRHNCPAKRPAMLIATTAIERLTGWLCDIELTVPRNQLQWRQGPFHRALAELPARFTPITPDQTGANPWTTRSSSSTPPAATSRERRQASARQAPPSR